MDNLDISVYKKQMTPKQKRRMILLLIIYLGLTMFVSFINRNRIEFSILGTVLPTSVISGIISSLCIATGLMMTQNHWYYGGILCYFLFLISLFFVFISIFASHHPESFPGFFFILSGYLINTVTILNLKKLDQEKLLSQKLIITDSITGLYNRRGIQTYIENLVSENKPFYLLFLDLDNFKTLNDTFGHSYGDKMLKIMADRWLSIPKPDGIIARNGGDEYLIAIPCEENFSIENFAAECVRRAEEIIDLGEGKKFKTSASVGVAAFPANGSTADELLIKADFAMYESKHKGKNCYTISNS